VRFCRQFVNVVATAAATQKINNPGEFSALMRLHGLFEFLPWIRNDPVALGDMLDREDTAGILHYAASLAGRPALSEETVESVTAFMRGTRHMQPFYAGWPDFVARGANRRANEEDGPDLKPFLVWDETSGRDEFLELWIETDLKSASETRAEKRALLYQEELMKQLRPADERRPTEADRLAYTYLIHRLWQADADFIKQRDIHDHFFAAGHTPRPFWWIGSNELPAEPPRETDRGVAELFLQIAWPLPPQAIGVYAGAVAAANIGTRRGDNGLARWLDRLLTDGEDRKPGFLTLFGDYIGNVSGGELTGASFYGLVLESLPAFATLTDDHGALDWKRIRRLADLQGRILRDGQRGALRPIEPFIRAVLSVSGQDRTALRNLMLSVAAALPRFGGPADGHWSGDAVQSLKVLFDPPDDAPPGEAFRETLEFLSYDDAAPNLLLLAVAAGNAEAVRMVASRWRPPSNWQGSYADLFVELLRTQDSPSRRTTLGATLWPHIRCLLRSLRRSSGITGKTYSDLFSLIRDNTKRDYNNRRFATNDCAGHR
jgi:hypothetical protein